MVLALNRTPPGNARNWHGATPARPPGLFGRRVRRWTSWSQKIGRRIATAESCTAGLHSGTAHRPARVVPSTRRAQWWPTLTGEGAASRWIRHDRGPAGRTEPVAQAMAAGALPRRHRHRDRRAGPERRKKPVGTLFTVLLDDGNLTTRAVRLPGASRDVRRRSTTVAMHLLRRTLSGIGLTLATAKSTTARQSSTREDTRANNRFR